MSLLKKIKEDKDLIKVICGLIAGAGIATGYVIWKNVDIIKNLAPNAIYFNDLKADNIKNEKGQYESIIRYKGSPVLKVERGKNYFNATQLDANYKK